MDLLNSIRKEGSRGGVDFKWSDVETSQHRENYLGHSLKAPVGRWQRNKDLSWYAKPDSDRKVLNKEGKEETEAERNARERKEEIRRVKEAEEDALARALGLPVLERNGLGTGANNIDVGEMKRVIKETEAGDDEIDEVGRGRRFGAFVGNVGMDEGDDTEASHRNAGRGGLIEKDEPGRKTAQARGNDGSRSRSRSRSRDRRHRRPRHRDGSKDGREKHRHRHREDQRGDRRGSADRPRERRDRSPKSSRQERHRRSRSPERYRERRDRSRSRSHSSVRRDKRGRIIDRYMPRRDDRERRKSLEIQSRRSRSPDRRDRNR